MQVQKLKLKFMNTMLENVQNMGTLIISFSVQINWVNYILPIQINVRIK